jgi:hypothetical protein
MPNQREHRGHRDQLISFLISSVFSVSSVVKMPDGCRIEMGVHLYIGKLKSFDGSEVTRSFASTLPIDLNLNEDHLAAIMLEGGEQVVVVCMLRVP